MNGKVIAYKEIGLRVLGFKELGMHGLSDGAGGVVFGDYDKDGLIFQLDCGKNGGSIQGGHLMILDGDNYVRVQLATGEYITLKDK